MNKSSLCFKEIDINRNMTPGQKPPSHSSIGWSTEIGLLFGMALERLLHFGRAKKVAPEENIFSGEELHFVENINRQCKAAWRIRKYRGRRGKSIFIIDSN
jgi:hypothetical protein